MDDSVRDIVSQLLTADVKQRLGCDKTYGAKAVTWHPFFRGVDWNALHAQVITAPIIPKVGGPLEGLTTIPLETARKQLVNSFWMTRAPMNHSLLTHFAGL